MANEEAIEILSNMREKAQARDYAINLAIEALKAQLTEKDTTSDCISRQMALNEIAEWMLEYGALNEKRERDALQNVARGIKKLPSVQPEPLTDKEQRIFLAAMGREEKVCEEVDRNHIREPYEDSLMRVCKEIRRKVKSALWT